MIDETIAKIEARLKAASAVKGENKAELLSLLAELKSEVSKLSQTHADEAQSIAGFTQVSAHEATREQRNPHLLELSTEALASSVAEFETSHPKLVQTVNAICTTLSNLGI